jgi:hypothetical protein
MVRGRLRQIVQTPAIDLPLADASQLMSARFVAS